jgi:hypothetical protein
MHARFLFSFDQDKDPAVKQSIPFPDSELASPGNLAGLFWLGEHHHFCAAEALRKVLKRKTCSGNYCYNLCQWFFAGSQKSDE